MDMWEDSHGTPDHTSGEWFKNKWYNYANSYSMLSLLQLLPVCAAATPKIYTFQHKSSVYKMSFSVEVFQFPKSLRLKMNILQVEIAALMPALYSQRVLTTNPESCTSDCWGSNAPQSWYWQNGKFPTMYFNTCNMHALKLMSNWLTCLSIGTRKIFSNLHSFKCVFISEQDCFSAIIPRNVEG